MTEQLVNPDRYTSKGGRQLFDVIEMCVRDSKSGIMAAYSACIIRYAFRWWKKGGVHDLQKILVYLDRIEIATNLRCSQDTGVSHLDKGTSKLLDWVSEDFCDIDDEDISGFAKTLMKTACEFAMDPVCEYHAFHIRQAVAQLLDKIKEH